MNWQTEVPVTPGSPKITYGQPILVTGSCFAQHLGDKLAYFGYQHLTNPFGVIFHPLPLVRLLERAVDGREFTCDDLFENNGLWFCLETHSSLYAKSSDALLVLLNDKLKTCREYIAKSSHLVLTLGTGWGYTHLDRRLLVANCHKLPSGAFHKELTRIDSIEKALRKLIKRVRTVNPAINLIFTVSPVRHIRDGFVENNRSKAHLLAAVHQVVENNEQAHYFPSFEILIDQLRDYRFYADDMIHPSAQAVLYIWERFAGNWLDPLQALLRKKVDSVQRRLNHRPLYPDSPDHVQFKERLKKDIADLREELPWIDFPK